MKSNGILTLAIGKKYRKQAKYLAYSCILNSPSLPRAIITDDCDYFKELYDIVIKYDENMGNPFEVKLRLDLFTPFYETLFLDSDTLVYSDLRFFWENFRENSFVYAGTRKSTGIWYMDISQILKKFNLSWIPTLNSGTFLFRKDKIGCETLNFAAYLYKNPEGIEIPYFRGKMLPDEPFLSIALAKNNQFPIEEKEDFGRLGRSLIDAAKVKINVVKGISKFFKGDDLNFVIVVHFIGGFVGRYYYFIEKLRLKFYFYSLTDVFAPIFYGLEFIKRKIKNRR